LLLLFEKVISAFMKPIQQNESFRLPKRLQGVAPTLIRQIFNRALPGSINFGLGEPDLPTPQFIREEAARVTLEEQNGYTNHAGILELREKIAESYPHLNLNAEQVCVTVGSQEAMTAAFLALVEAGDEVLIPNPSFPAYENCVNICEAKSVFYRLPAEKDFGFDIEEFKSKITPKTKVAVVISPSNPTGKIFTEEDLRQIAEVWFVEIFEYDGLARWLGRQLANRCRQSVSDPARIFDGLHFDDLAESIASRLDGRSRKSKG
jgi:DNA-binding transcriptional MocR family regulator